jgi:pimeloyl-ACP methyl ester carboxylesterase
LLIWGEDDQITPPSSAYEFLNHLPNAELKWISRCGHAPMMENPTLFAHYCDEFFSTLAGNLKQEHLIQH